MEISLFIRSRSSYNVWYVSSTACIVLWYIFWIFDIKIFPANITCPSPYSHVSYSKCPTPCSWESYSDISVPYFVYILCGAQLHIKTLLQLVHGNNTQHGKLLRFLWSSHMRSAMKDMFLKISQENICTGVAIVINLHASGLQLYQKRRLWRRCFLGNSAKSTFFSEDLQTTASEFYKWK